MSRRVKPIEPAPIIAILMSLFIAGCMLTGCYTVAQVPHVDTLWDYSDPAASEQKFEQQLVPVTMADDRQYHVVLLTQIARAQGLQDRFDDAHKTLDEAEAMLRDDMHLPRVRCLLERGRVFNSSGQPGKAMPLFGQAWKLAERANLWRYAIDAVHMLAIAAPTPREQIEWGLRGIAMVEQHPDQKRWLHALYNNLGESHAKAGQYRDALGVFEKLAAINGNDTYTMKDQARMLRLMGRVDRATAIIRPIHERLEAEGKPDGWISEEYGECLLAAGRRDEATPHFKVAYALLKDDAWVVKHDPARLERLRGFANAR